MVARVIRPDSRRVVPSEVVNAREEARALVEEARLHCDGLRAAAELEAHRAREQAAQSGRASGYAETMRHLIEARSAQHTAVRDAREQIIRLAVELARKILKDELALAPERVRTLACDLLERASRARQLQLHVHPDDVDLLRPLFEDEAVTLVPDPELTRGDCVLVTESGVIDGRIETRIDALEQALRT